MPIKQEAACGLCEVTLEEDGACRNQHCPRGRETMDPPAYPTQESVLIPGPPLPGSSFIDPPFQVVPPPRRVSSGTIKAVRPTVPDEAPPTPRDGRLHRDAYPPPPRSDFPRRDTEPMLPVFVPEPTRDGSDARDEALTDRPTPVETPSAHRHGTTHQSGTHRRAKADLDADDDTDFGAG